MSADRPVRGATATGTALSHRDRGPRFKAALAHRAKRFMEVNASQARVASGGTGPHHIGRVPVPGAAVGVARSLVDHQPTDVATSSQAIVVTG